MFTVSKMECPQYEKADISYQELRMHIVFNKIIKLLDNSIRRGRLYDNRVGIVSGYIWRWPRTYLIVLISLLVTLDYTTTYILLECSGKVNVYEAGIFAGWALYNGGYAGLLLFDIFSLIILVFTAIGIRYILFRYGFSGFGKLTFLALLMPYALTTTVAVISNIVLTLL
jgi:hypothetical protein